MQYSAIQWEDLDTTDAVSRISVTEIIGWLIALVAAIVVIALSIPFQRMVMTEEEIEAKYGRRYNWLNRCNVRCESKVSVGKLHAQLHCTALAKWFDEPRNHSQIEWRLAVDDRATSLGCTGFPKEMSVIRKGAEAMVEKMDDNIDKVTEERKKSSEDLKAQIALRYMQSLQQGKVSHLIQRAYPDIYDDYTMVITIADAWYFQSPRLQKQAAEVLWQKWVNVKDPAYPNKPRIRILDPDGKVIGGSPAGAAFPIWYGEENL